MSRGAFGRGSYTCGRMSVYVDIVRYRELFGSLFRRDLRARYKGSVLGVAWSLANPLVLMGVYLLVFSVLWRVVNNIDHYPLYLLSGLAVWVFFATSLQSASRSMIDYSELIRKVRFPRQLVAFSTVATQLVAFVAMLVVLIVVNLIALPRVRTEIWLAIPLAALVVGLVFGLALAVASANVVFRDVEHLVSAALLPWFFLTPVLYSIDKLSGFDSHPTVKEVLRWGNPVTPPIEALRAPLYLGRLPHWTDVVYLLGVTAAALALGAWVFSRVDDRIAVEL
jgi:ABC-type polysaccharide/polyol phosphate export permease